MCAAHEALEFIVLLRALSLPYHLHVPSSKSQPTSAVKGRCGKVQRHISSAEGLKLIACAEKISLSMRVAKMTRFYPHT